MKRISRPSVALVAGVLLGIGCDQRAAFDSFVPKEEAAFGQRVFEQLQRHQFEPVEAVLNPTVNAGGPIRAQLERVASLFPGDAPRQVRIVGAVTNTVNGTRHVNLTYEYEYPQQWLLANIVLRQDSGRQVIDGLHVAPAADSQERLNAFELRGKDLVHYAILIWTVIVPAFILITLIVLLKTRVPGRRWLWVVGVLLGFGRLSFNWTTGETTAQVLQVVLFGAGFFKAAPYGPLTLMSSVPVGAIAFLWRRRQWLLKTPRPPHAISDIRETGR